MGNGTGILSSFRVYSHLEPLRKLLLRMCHNFEVEGTDGAKAALNAECRHGIQWREGQGFPVPATDAWH